LKHFDNEPDEEFGNMKPLMRFQGAKNHVHCLAYALNRIVQDILHELKSSTIKQTQANEDDWEIASPVAKLQHIVV
jgi:hypothetical protein